MNILSSYDEIISIAALVAAMFCLVQLMRHDLKDRKLPNIYNAVLAFSGVVFHIITGFSYQSLTSIMLGAFSGFMIFALSYWIFLKLKKIEGAGMGDFKFAIAAGFWLGVDGIALMLMVSSILLILYAIVYALIKNVPVRSLKLPFGLTGCPVTGALILYFYALPALMALLAAF